MGRTRDTGGEKERERERGRRDDGKNKRYRG